MKSGAYFILNYMLYTELNNVKNSISNKIVLYKEQSIL